MNLDTDGRKRATTRAVQVRDLTIGGGSPVSVQSMCATRTQDIDATVRQVELLQEHGADLIRIAVDSRKDLEALAEIRRGTEARLVVDLQENYRLVTDVAPLVDKIRYNPGHLYHHQRDVPVLEKVRLIVDTARAHDCALRIGVNFGSIDPEHRDSDPLDAALKSVSEHIEMMDQLGFDQFVVSLKSSDPNAVIEINERFAELFPEVPLHLGVTEAGMLPMGEIKSRIAFEQLLGQGIGDTLRVSLTLPFDRKFEEIVIGRQIVEDVKNGRFRSVPRFEQNGLNIISCPSCSRVENEAFIDLAKEVERVAAFAAEENITIAVMGCRVNGPGETDDADLGLWCAPGHVNLKRKEQLLGKFSYEEILGRVETELRQILSERGSKRSEDSTL